MDPSRSTVTYGLMRPYGGRSVRRVHQSELNDKGPLKALRKRACPVAIYCPRCHLDIQSKAGLEVFWCPHCNVAIERKLTTPVLRALVGSVATIYSIFFLLADFSPIAAFLGLVTLPFVTIVWVRRGGYRLLSRNRSPMPRASIAKPGSSRNGHRP